MNKISAIGTLATLPENIQSFLRRKGLSPGQNTEVIAWYHTDDDGKETNYGGYTHLEYSDDPEAIAFLEARKNSTGV